MHCGLLALLTFSYLFQTVSLHFCKLAPIEEFFRSFEQRYRLTVQRETTVIESSDFENPLSPFYIDLSISVYPIPRPRFAAPCYQMKRFGWSEGKVGNLVPWGGDWPHCVGWMA